MQTTKVVKPPLGSRMMTAVIVCFLWLAAVQLLNLYVVRTRELRLAAAASQDASAQVRLAELTSKAGLVQTRLISQWNSGSQESAEQFRAESLRLDEEIADLTLGLRALLLRPDERVTLDEFQFAWLAYAGARASTAPDQAGAGLPQEVVQSGTVAMDRLRDLQVIVSEQVQDRMQAAGAQRMQVQNIMMTMSVLATLPALLLAVFVVNQIAKTAESLTSVARLVAAGDLDWTLQVDASDELGSLSEAMNRLIRNTRRIAAARREAVEQLDREMADRRRLETTLAAERKGHEALLPLLGDGVITTDAAGRVVRLNRAAERLTGLSQREMVGRPIADFLPGVSSTHPSMGPSVVHQTLTSGRVSARADRAMLVAKDGTHRTVTFHTTPIHDADDRVIGVTVVCRESSRPDA